MTWKKKGKLKEVKTWSQAEPEMCVEHTHTNTLCLSLSLSLCRDAEGDYSEALTDDS